MTIDSLSSFLCPHVLFIIWLKTQKEGSVRLLICANPSLPFIYNSILLKLCLQLNIFTLNTYH